MKRERVHFVGIGGYGMGPLAKIMLDMGHEVSGSDVKVSERTRRMADHGARIAIGHQADNVGCSIDLVVTSAAVPADNPELERARSLGILILSHAQMVGRLLADMTGIGVTGTHGKTTTTAMVATTLARAGLSPTVLIGGEIEEFAGGGKLGQGEYFVVEADEAYGRFLEMHPRIAAVTNIDNDHLDYYGNFENIKAAFVRFISGLPNDGLAVMNIDDDEVLALAGVSGKPTVTYGIKRAADVMAVDIRLFELGSEFTAMYMGANLGKITLRVPGRHNVSNSLAAIAIARHLGIAFGIIAEAIEAFKGVKRRFEVYGLHRDVMIVDDYAHHPTEIKAVLEAARAGWKRRLIAVFQPQRFTRTESLMSEFARAFDVADIVVLTDIYYEGTGEQPIAGVTSSRMLQLLQEHWRSLGRETTAIHIGRLDDVVKYLRSICRGGDLVITMGAGNVSRVAAEMNDELRSSAKM